MALRGWIISVIVCLAAGAVVNIAVAWAGAAYTDLSGVAPGMPPVTGRLPPGAPAGWQPAVMAQEFGGRFAHRAEWMGSIAPEGANANGMVWKWRQTEAGWPRRSLRATAAYEFESPRTSEPTRRGRAMSAEWGVLSGGVELPEWVQRWTAMKSGRLPLRPMWPGWALNTGLYAGLAWLWFVAPGVWLRAQRRRRGECEGCGYELAGLASDSVCPECGRERAGAR